MGILGFLIGLLGYGVLLMIDVATLFVVIRLICREWPIRILVAFDQVGGHLVDPLSRQVAKGWHVIRPKTWPTKKQELALTLLALVGLRFVTSTLCSMLIGENPF